ncbi:MAG TPA: excinuclease ABC subunit A, partial [Sutterella sp.]|nr:excinuclease ABC subunit A [Sutterella sp.]
VVVEHDPQVMMNADRIIDMGPGSGEQGGSIVFDGTPAQILEAESLTGLYLKGRLRVDTSLSRVPEEAFRSWLTVKGAREHNLKNIDVSFPLGAISVVTGVSGSGKSTLVGDILVPALERSLGKAVACGDFDEIIGRSRISEVMFVDQSAVGKTTRSNPVSYVDAFGPIRTLFAGVPLARDRGYKPGDFSFNSGAGRCPTCQGAGFERVEMQFLSDVFLRCPDCDGTRYRAEIREVTINLDGRREVSVADVLEMTVDQACQYFRAEREIVRRLKPLQDVGLGYVKLGQPVSTLSGGEAQR